MPKRRNGLSSPHSKMQISTWFMLPILMIEFLIFSTPTLPLVVSILVTILFIGSCIAACIFGYLATALDPMDPRLSHDDEQSDLCPCWYRVFSMPKRQQQHSPGIVTGINGLDGAEENENDPAGIENATEERTKYCFICQKEVAEHSMHCKYCQKCVAHFDHHCQWLNTCVGSRNYPFFRKTLWSIASVLVIHTFVGLGIAIDILAGGSSRERAEEWFSANLPELVVSFLLAFSLLDSLALILIIQLLLFHLKLSRMKLTTYQFILRDAAEKRENSTIEKEIDSRRNKAIGNAKHSKQHFKVFQLKMGAHLRKCHPCLDTIPSAEEEQETNETKSGEEKRDE